MSLEATDFEGFFTEIYGYLPFAWQKELARRVCEDGWPKMLDMPTASGKTAVIDIAVFHLALEASSPDRRAPVRIAFIVDRRLVVDDAFKRARDLAKKLAAPKTRTVKLVAEGLKSISPENPLRAVKLRGGMPQDRDWYSSPAQPLVIASTVDQIGSRLLFRGYGVSDSMKPVHAGLLGADTLFILDEAHTSKPFLCTLNRIRGMRKERNKCGGIRQFEAVFMSATMADDAGVFPPKNMREKFLSGDEALRRRIEAHKCAKMVEAGPGKGAEKIVAMALEVADASDGRGSGGDSPRQARSVGVVVNRVNLAREVFVGIQRRVEESGMRATAHLLTGRSRPLDRDAYIKNEIDKIRPGSDSRYEGTMFFVATQCIEVGVDIDFDAMVTQVAPLDSLRQRFGRLDRIGAAGRSIARIVADKRDVSASADDPIYEDKMATTWKYLKKIANEDGVVDFGVAHLDPDRDTIKETAAPTARPVSLMPAYVQFLMQTSPRPSPDPEPSLFLHGAGSKSADIHVLWRADLTPDALGDENPDKAKRGLETCGPSPLEAISVPIWAAKKWLAGEGVEDVGDVEGTKQGQERATAGGADRLALRWCGAKSDRTKAIRPGELHPGDTIAVPAAYGGCDMYGWNQSSIEPVTDIGTEANIIHRRRLAVRLDEDLAGQYGGGESLDHVRKIAAEHANDSDTGGLLDALASDDALPSPWKDILVAMNSDDSEVWRGGDRRIHPQTATTPDGDIVTGFWVNLSEKGAAVALSSLRQTEESRPRGIEDRGDSEAAESSTDDEADAGLGVEVELDPHCRGVRDHVEEFCARTHTGKNMSDDMMLAGLLHDVGKAERREQAFLRKMDPDDVTDKRVLAKSAHKLANYNEYARYTRMARLPERYRHECWSVSLAEDHPALKSANDPELVKYLIGTHHGHGRPMFPPADDAHADGHIDFTIDGTPMRGRVDHGLTRLDSGWIDMCARLSEKYGPWNLAYMEAVVRLADHRQSESEERNAE